MIVADALCKNFWFYQKEPSLWGACKSFFHRKWQEKKVLTDLSFEIQPGEIVGLVGPNGAGKTTLIKILSGIIHPSAGKVTVLGYIPSDRKKEFRKNIGLIMGQKTQLWWDLPALDCFLLNQAIYKIPNAEFKERLNVLSEILEVSDYLKVPVRKLSLGQRMKMELIFSLLHHPKVVYLDEPTLGLDYSAQKAIRFFLKEYNKRYKPIVILTSHYMADIESLCHKILLLNKGNLIFQGPLNKLMESYSLNKIVTIILNSPFPCDLSNKWLLSASDTRLEVILKVPTQALNKDLPTFLSNLDIADISIKDEDIAEVIHHLLIK